MKSNLYTNTGKVGSIAGLIVTTLVVSYVSQNSTKIVDGSIAIAKTGLKPVKKLINNALTKEVAVWSTAPTGHVYDTGMKIRVSKFSKI